MSWLTLLITLAATAATCHSYAEAEALSKLGLREEGIRETRRILPWKFPPPVLFHQDQKLHVAFEGSIHVSTAVFYMAVNLMSKSSQTRYKISFDCSPTDPKGKLCEATGGPVLKSGDLVHYSIKVVLSEARIMWLTNQRWSVEYPPATLFPG